jgi:hypothetical protein
MRTPLIILCLAVVLLFADTASAQINESDTAVFQSRISFTGNYQSGNVEILTLRTKAELLWAPLPDLVFKSQNNSLYQNIYAVKADNDLFSRNYLYFSPHRKIYPYLIGYISSNYRRKIDFRYFAGAGLTVQLLRNQKQLLKLSGNLVYEKTVFADTVFNDAHYNGLSRQSLFRATAYMNGWVLLFQKKLRLAYDVYWQPALSRISNNRLSAEITADIPLYHGLSFTLLHRWTNETVVVRRVQSNDQLLTWGLSYQFISARKKHPGL